MGITMADKMIDPVCGMEVNPSQAAEKVSYEDKTYYFCAPGCKVKFEQDPDKYLRDKDLK